MRFVVRIEWNNQQDQELQELEARFYDFLEEAGSSKFELEDILSAFSAKCIRIAYLQGVIDFYNLCLILREDVQDILQKYFDVVEVLEK